MAYRLLHDLLSQTAARWPDREAIRLDGQALTYSRLDAYANQVSRALRKVGVRRGDRIGLYVHKSITSVVGIFGIMKAGAVYVPLDAAAPASRSAYIARDCDIRVLITSARMEGLPGLLAAAPGIETVLFGDDEELDVLQAVRTLTWDEVLEQDERPLDDVGATDTDLAYLLYTSGSTGEPKGVMIAHRTVMPFIDWCNDTFAMTPDDRVTSHAPLHFDLSTFDIYATIKAGGTIVLVPETLSVFPAALADLIEQERITITYLVPSILSLMVAYGNLGDHDLSHLRLVLFAGEPFPIKYLRGLHAAIPNADHYNLYGPTETNVCTYYKVRPTDLQPDRTLPVPIGIACTNIEVFAVDEHLQPVAQPGVEGELWVRGTCVALGYWRDRDRTARSFVQNPFQSDYDEVVYRTGDIVSLASDGVNWIYVGRKDQMVKSRGYRIELGEIEAALYRHDGVKEAAAVAVPDDLIGNRIHAFVVVENAARVTPADLEKHLRRIVPRYMTPERIELCPELPKTSTGKINRPALVRSRR